MNRSLTLVIIALLASGNAKSSAILSAPFISDYSLVSLAGPAGVPTVYGGLTFLDDNTLLLGGAANGGSGVIDAVNVIRDSNGDITGFGTVTQLAAAPFIDGGLTFGPGGDLFFTEYPINSVGELLPGSTSPDLTVSLNGNVGGSVGTLAFVPTGFDGAGGLVIGSYSAGTFCTAALTPDSTVTGTYDIGACNASAANTTGGGPEGIIYVPEGSTDFTGQTALVSLYSQGTVGAYSIDADGLPIASTFTPFITGLTGAEGAVIDPVTGDFLFSTFGGGNQIVEVQGFAAPIVAPEPEAFFIMALGLAIVSSRTRAEARRPTKCNAVTN